MYKNTKIGHLITGFLLLLVLILFVGYAGYQGIKNVNEKSQAVENMTSIMNNVQTALQAEEAFIIHGDPVYKERVYYYLDLVPRQATLSREIYKDNFDAVNQDRMDQVLTYTKDFRESFDRYVEADNEEQLVRADIVSKTEEILQNSDEIYKDQLTQYRENISAGAPSEVLQLKLTNAQEIERISIITMEARNEYQNYIITPNDAYAGNFEQHMQNVIDTTTDLEKGFVKQENLDRGEIIVSNARDIQTSFDRLKLLKNRKTIEEQNMRAIASNVSDITTEASADQKSQLKNLMSDSINNIILITLLLILIGAILIYVILSLYRKPIYELLEAADKVSRGDLTVEINDTSRSEISQLSVAFKSMIQSLRGLIKEIQDSSFHLVTLSEEMSASSEEVAAASRRISDTASEISNGAEIQSTKVIDITHAMQDMTHNIQEIADSTQKVSRNTNLVNNSVTNIGNSSKEVLLKMDLIRSSVNETESVIKDLDSKSQQINEIVTLITRIADQTNMLALNAAIEAARAGEHGKGFSVVADEVRKLAEESGRAAKSISKLIDEIRDSIGNTVERIETSKNDVQNGSLSVGKEMEMVTGIVSTINQITNMIEDIAAATEEQSTSIEEITSTLEDISSLSEQFAAGTQETAAALEEQSSSMSELANMATDLALLGDRMKKATEKFKLGNLRENEEIIGS
ncbi:MAG: methyl-accepting chemotaxis protein [Methanosarcina sp.]